MTNGGNQPIITLQSFKNVLPKPSVLYSLRTRRRSRSPTLLPPHSFVHSHPRTTLVANKFSAPHWTGCLPIRIRDSPDTCAFRFICVQMRLWGAGVGGTPLGFSLIKVPLFFFFFFKKPILPPVGLLYGKGTHSTIQSLLHFDCVASSSERTALASEQLPVVRSEGVPRKLCHLAIEGEKRETAQMNWNTMEGVVRNGWGGGGGHNHNTCVSVYLYTISSCFYHDVR